MLQLNSLGHHLNSSGKGISLKGRLPIPLHPERIHNNKQWPTEQGLLCIVLVANQQWIISFNFPWWVEQICTRLPKKVAKGAQHVSISSLAQPITTQGTEWAVLVGETTTKLRSFLLFIPFPDLLKLFKNALVVIVDSIFYCVIY
jgi:hypothetical protein